MIDYLKLIGIPLYLMRPKPFGLGYNQYKIHLIKKILGKRSINLKHYIDERIVEIPWIMRELEKIRYGKILDAGCTLNFNYLIKRIIKNKNNLTFVNIFPEKNVFKSNLVEYKTQDISKLEQDGNIYDIITCISVLEHVGFDNSMYDLKKTKDIYKIDINLYKNALVELKRVLKNDKWLYLTIPFGKKTIFRNYQQFDINDLNSIIKIFSPKQFKTYFYKFENLQWNEVDQIKCQSTEAIYKKDIGISSKSVALIKMKK